MVESSGKKIMPEKLNHWVMVRLSTFFAARQTIASREYPTPESMQRMIPTGLEAQYSISLSSTTSDSPMIFLMN